MDRVKTTKTRVREIMVTRGTSSPTEISKILKRENNISITPPGVFKHIKAIKADAKAFYALTAESLYELTAQRDFEMLEGLIVLQEQDIQDMYKQKAEIMLDKPLEAMQARHTSPTQQTT